VRNARDARRPNRSRLAEARYRGTRRQRAAVPLHDPRRAPGQVKPMLAAVPSWLMDIGIAAGVITAIITAAITLSRLRPLRWGWRTAVAEPLARFQRAQILHVVEPRFCELRNELRPNGGSSAVD